METHVKILAILNIVLGSLGLIAALLMLVIFGGVAGLASGAMVDQPDARFAVPIIGLIGGFVTIVVLVISIPAVIAGIGLLQFKEWARVLTIVLSAINLLNVPFGTALGIYGLWVLMSNQTVALFTRARAASNLPSRGF